jgi:GTP-binding protein Era
MSYRAGCVGIVGLPNAGKSTLTNVLVGEKVSIVTRKAQTTRQRVAGIISTEEYQLVLMDSPGIISKTRGLNTFLQDEYKDVIKQSDVIVACLNIDERQPDELKKVLECVQQSRKPYAVVITKDDLPYSQRTAKIRGWIDRGAPVVAVTALKAESLCRELVLEKIIPLLPEAPAPLYPNDQYTTQTTRELVAEIIREKCFEYVHQEVPYGLAVVIDLYKETSKLTEIYATILLEKDGHKGILIGDGGRKLKQIGSEARKDIEKIVGGKVFLKLFSKAHKSWHTNPRMLKELGYVVQR